jgi:Tfp pilus assembly protein PilV
MKLRIAKPDLPNNEQGFTLIETCIALVVMMVVGLAAAGSFVFAIRYNSAAADRATSMSIAQTAIEKFRAVSFTDSSLNAGTTTSTVYVCDTNCNAGNAGRTYSVTTTIANKTVVSGKTTIKSITISVVPVAPIIPIDSSNYAAGYEYYGSVKLYTERSNPLVGTNIN